MEINELRKKENIDLNKLLSEERKKFFQVYMDLKTGKDKNSKKKRESKKLISRIMTVIREKEILNG